MASIFDVDTTSSNKETSGILGPPGDDVSNIGSFMAGIGSGLFKIPEGIYLTSLNYDTGKKSLSGEKNTIIEALKIKDINNINNNNLISINGRDRLIKFRQFY